MVIAVSPCKKRATKECQNCIVWWQTNLSSLLSPCWLGGLLVVRLLSSLHVMNVIIECLLWFLLVICDGRSEGGR